MEIQEGDSDAPGIEDVPLVAYLRISDFLFTDAEAGEDPAQQVVAAEGTSDLA